MCHAQRPTRINHPIGQRAGLLAAQTTDDALWSGAPAAIPRSG